MAEVTEVVLYGYVTWTIAHGTCGPLREAHRGFLMMRLDNHSPSCSAPGYHMLLYHEVQRRTGCGCIEAAVVREIPVHAGHVMCMRKERLPNTVIREVMVRRKMKAGRPAKRLQHCFTECVCNFGVDETSWIKVVQDVSE